MNRKLINDGRGEGEGCQAREKDKSILPFRSIEKETTQFGRGKVLSKYNVESAAYEIND